MSLVSSTGLIKNLTNRSPLVYQVRWSVWPSSFVDPIPRKDDQEVLVKEEPTKFKELAYSPIKATPSSYSASHFYDPFLRRFTHTIMRKGKKDEYESMLRDVLYWIKKEQLKGLRAAKTPEEKEKFQPDPLEVMKQAIANVKPVVHTRPIQKGGVTYSVPFPLADSTSEFIGMKWINEAAHDHPQAWRAIHGPALVREIIFAFNKEGPVIKRKYELHKLAETNKAYAHYRWD